MTQSKCAQKAQVGWGGLIALVAVGWRWSHLVQSGRDPIVEVLWMTTDQTSEAGSMLFTACLATWTQIAGGTLVGLRGAQVVVGVINSLLVWRLATVLLGSRTGVVAGLLAACYGPFVYAGSQPDPQVWAVLFVLAGLLLVARPGSQPGLSGLLLALACALAPQTGLLVLVALWRIVGQKGWNGGAVLVVAWTVCLVAVGWWLDGWPLQITPNASQATESWIDHFYGPWRAGEWTAHGDPYTALETTAASILMWDYGLAFPFGLIGPLSLLALVRTWRIHMRDSGQAMALYASLASVGGVILYGGNAAVRGVAVPMMIMMAAYQLVLWSRVNLLWQQRGLYAIVLLVLAGFFNFDNHALRSAGSAYEHYRRGRTYEVLAMRANAIKEYERSLQNQSTLTAAHIALGRLYREADQLGQAIAADRAVLQVDPANQVIREALATTLLRAELPDEAIAELVSLRDGLHDGARFHGMLGDARLMAGDVRGAIEDYKTAEAVSPDSGRVVYHLARLYESTGFTAEAIECYQRLRVHQQWRQESGWRAAALLADRGLVDQAETLLRAVLAENADNPPALMGLGRLLAIAERYAAALPYFERLRVLNPDDYRTYFFLSKLYFRLQREAEAEKAFNSYQLGKRRAEMKESVEEDLEGVLRKFGEWTQ